MISLLPRGKAFRYSACGLIILVVFTLGCSHDLEVRNLDLYRPVFVESPKTDSRIGLTASTNTVEETRLVEGIANSMKKNGFKVTYPFYAREENKQTVDYIVKITTSSKFRGSGWNFLINWPGFLIWTPAWHGYNYGARFDFDVDIIETKTDSALPRLSVPVDLRFRHAAINRTWTEISWLEWSVIALIGGIVFTRYDKSVTPTLLNAIENRVSDYVAGKIAMTLISAQTSAE